MADLILESAHQLGDEGKYFTKTDVSHVNANGATIEWAGVLVHESLVTPGSLNIEVDGDFSNPTAGLTIHVNDNEVYSSLPDDERDHAETEPGGIGHVSAAPSLPPAHQEVIDECIAEAWRNVEASDANTTADIAADIAQRLHYVYGAKAVID